MPTPALASEWASRLFPSRKAFQWLFPISVAVVLAIEALHLAARSIKLLEFVFLEAGLASIGVLLLLHYFGPNQPSGQESHSALRRALRWYRAWFVTFVLLMPLILILSMLWFLWRAA